MIHRLIWVFILSGLLSACGVPSPSSEDLTKALSADISKQWEIEDLDIEVTENVGTKTEPFIKSRFKSEILLKEDTFSIFKKVAVNPDVYFVEPVHEKGHVVTIYGVASSRLRNNKWVSSFSHEKDISSLTGMSIAGQEHKFILKGSDAEEKFYKKKREAAIKQLIRIVKNDKQYKGSLLSNGRPAYKVDMLFNSYSEKDNTFSGSLAIGNGQIITDFNGKIEGEKLRLIETKYVKSSTARKLGKDSPIIMEFDGSLKFPYGKLFAAMFNSDGKVPDYFVIYPQK